jgi:hypothetical protein
MACLSIVREHGPATVAAKSIFLFNAMTSIPGAEITFEVFDADAGQLKGLVGEHRFFHGRRLRRRVLGTVEKPEAVRKHTSRA